jgi:hypothetical protein
VLDALDLLLGRFGQRVEMRRQFLALLGVEDGVSLEEWDFLFGLLAVFGLVGLLERAGVDHG